MQTVRWGRDEDVEEVLARDPPQTKLLAFFEILADEELYPPGGDVTPSSEILYPDLTLHFTWLSSDKAWRRRRRTTQTIGRIFLATPNEGERFYPRTLLYRVPGPTSFKCLRTYNSVVHPTFHAACVARGIFADDSEWAQAMRSSVQSGSARQCANLYTRILLQGECTSPAALLNEFWRHMIDDTHYAAGRLTGDSMSIDDPQHRFFDRCLLRVSNLLALADKELADFDLPQPDEPHPAPFVAAEAREHRSAARSFVTFDHDTMAEQLNAQSVRTHIGGQLWDLITTCYATDFTARGISLQQLAMTANLYTHIQDLLLQPPPPIGQYVYQQLPKISFGGCSYQSTDTCHG